MPASTRRLDLEDDPVDGHHLHLVPGADAGGPVPGRPPAGAVHGHLAVGCQVGLRRAHLPDQVVAADGRKDAEEMAKLRQAAEIISIPADVLHHAYDRYFEETQA